MATYLVCYDIGGDRERGKVHRLLKRHGNPIQESVFELHRIDEPTLTALKQQLQNIVTDPATLRFYRLGADALSRSHDLAGVPLGRRPLFVIL